MAAIVILVILGFLTVAVIDRLPSKADRIRCTQNLKTLYLALNQYTEDNGHWPQPPPTAFDQKKAYEEFWIETLKPYDITEATWQCPGILRLGRIQQEGRAPRVQYMPTQFDDKPNTPKKWPNMPWVVEIGNAHGQGPLLILNDGSVHDWDTYMQKFAK